MLVVERKHHGNVKTSVIDADFLLSADYRRWSTARRPSAG